MHDNAVNNTRLTFNTAGKYTVGAGIQFEFNATGFREINIRKNGTSVIADVGLDANALNATELTLNCVDVFVVTDYIECMVIHNAGVALNVQVEADWSPEFWAQRIA